MESSRTTIGGRSGSSATQFRSLPPAGLEGPALLWSRATLWSRLTCPWLRRQRASPSMSASSSSAGLGQHRPLDPPRVVGRRGRGRKTRGRCAGEPVGRQVLARGSSESSRASRRLSYSVHVPATVEREIEGASTSTPSRRGRVERPGWSSIEPSVAGRATPALCHPVQASKSCRKSPPATVPTTHLLGAATARECRAPQRRDWTRPQAAESRSATERTLLAL